jgi:hypothetical protein
MQSRVTKNAPRIRRASIFLGKDSWRMFMRVNPPGAPTTGPNGELLGRPLTARGESLHGLIAARRSHCQFESLDDMQGGWDCGLERVGRDC